MMSILKSIGKNVIPYAIANKIRLRTLEKVNFSRRAALYRQLVPPGSKAFDIGANIGNRVLALLETGAEVIAVEPQYSCVALLKKTLGNRATVIQAAVGSAPGKLPLRLGKPLDTLATLSKDFIEHSEKSNRFVDHSWSQTIDVDVVTLDSLISTYGKPAFIKIDVEGYELEVLRGLSEPVDVVSFEWTLDMPDQAEKCIGYLEALGLRYFQFSFGETMAFTHESSVDAQRAVQLVRLLGQEQIQFGDIYASRKNLARR